MRAKDRLEFPSAWSQATVEALSPMQRGRLVEPVLVGDSATILRGELRRWRNEGQTPARILVVTVV